MGDVRGTGGGPLVRSGFFVVVPEGGVVGETRRDREGYCWEGCRGGSVYLINVGGGRERRSSVEGRWKCRGRTSRVMSREVDSSSKNRTFWSSVCIRHPGETSGEKRKSRETI